MTDRTILNVMMGEANEDGCEAVAERWGAPTIRDMPRTIVHEVVERH